MRNISQTVVSNLEPSTSLTQKHETKGRDWQKTTTELECWVTLKSSLENLSESHKKTKKNKAQQRSSKIGVLRENQEQQLKLS